MLAISSNEDRYGDNVEDVSPVVCGLYFEVGINTDKPPMVIKATNLTAINFLFLFIKISPFCPFPFFHF